MNTIHSEKRTNLLEQIHPSEALVILRILSREDSKVRDRIEEIFLSSVSKVDVPHLTQEIFSELDSLDVEGLWDRSGSHRHGYTEPSDAAQEMILEVIEPYFKNMQRLQALGMFREAMLYCIGIVSALRLFGVEGTTEFKEWTVDIPDELANYFISEWKQTCLFPDLMAEMENFEMTGSYEEEAEIKSLESEE